MARTLLEVDRILIRLRRELKSAEEDFVRAKASIVAANEDRDAAYARTLDLKHRLEDV